MLRSIAAGAAVSDYDRACIRLGGRLPLSCQKNEKESGCQMCYEAHFFAPHVAQLPSSTDGDAIIISAQLSPVRVAILVLPPPVFRRNVSVCPGFRNELSGWRLSSAPGEGDA